MMVKTCGECKLHLVRGECPDADYRDSKLNALARMSSDSACNLFEPRHQKKNDADELDMSEALELLNKHTYKCPEDTKKVLIYKDGIYENAEAHIHTVLEQEYGDNLKRSFVEEAYAHLQRANYIKREQINQFNNTIPIQNGLFNLLTRDVTPFDPEQVYTYKLNINYNPEAECPNWINFTKQVVAEEDIPLLQEIMGYCLLPDMPLHKIFWFYGSGRNGKGRVALTLEAVLTKANCSSLELHQFFGRFSLQRLYGKLLNVSSEPRLSKYGLDTTVIKLVTGQDTIDAEIKNKNAVLKFTNFAKPIVMGNRFPKVEDNSLGWWDRVETLSFPNSFEGENMIPNIETQWIPSELDGIFNWMLEGLYRLKQQNGFSSSKSAEETKLEFMKISDPFKAWIIECCIKIPSAYLTREEALTNYENYCDEIGAERDHKRVFFEKMRKEPRIKDKQKMLANKNVRVFEGVTLKKIDGEQETLASLAVLADTHIPIIPRYSQENNSNNKEIVERANSAKVAKDDDVDNPFYVQCFDCRKTLNKNEVCTFQGKPYCVECRQKLGVEC